MIVYRRSGQQPEQVRCKPFLKDPGRVRSTKKPEKSFNALLRLKVRSGHLSDRSAISLLGLKER